MFWRARLIQMQMILREFHTSMQWSAKATRQKRRGMFEETACKGAGWCENTSKAKLQALKVLPGSNLDFFSGWTCWGCRDMHPAVNPKAALKTISKIDCTDLRIGDVLFVPDTGPQVTTSYNFYVVYAKVCKVMWGKVVVMQHEAIRCTEPGCTVMECHAMSFMHVCIVAVAAYIVAPCSLTEFWSATWGLRLRPPVYNLISREAAVDTELDGYLIPKGTGTLDMFDTNGSISTKFDGKRHETTPSRTSSETNQNTFSPAQWLAFLAWIWIPQKHFAGISLHIGAINRHPGVCHSHLCSSFRKGQILGCHEVLGLGEPIGLQSRAVPAR